MEHIYELHGGRYGCNRAQNPYPSVNQALPPSGDSPSCEIFAPTAEGGTCSIHYEHSTLSTRRAPRRTLPARRCGRSPGGSAPESRRRRSRRFPPARPRPRSVAPVSATTCGCSSQSAATEGTRCSCQSRCPLTSLTASIHRFIDYLRSRGRKPEKIEACRQEASRARSLPLVRRAGRAETPAQPRAAACA